MHYALFQTCTMESPSGGRVGHVFLHTIQQSRFIFVVLTEVRVLEKRDTVLDLRLIADGRPVIVGISAIQAGTPYMVPLTIGTTVSVDWEVEWL